MFYVFLCIFFVCFLFLFFFANYFFLCTKQLYILPMPINRVSYVVCIAIVHSQTDCVHFLFHFQWCCIYIGRCAKGAQTKTTLIFVCQFKIKCMLCTFASSVSHTRNNLCWCIWIVIVVDKCNLECIYKTKERNIRTNLKGKRKYNHFFWILIANHIFFFF